MASLDRSNALIGFALALAIVGSAVGVLAYEDDRLATFQVTWTSTATEAAFPTATVTGAGEAESRLDVTQRNLTGATLTVSIDASLPARVQPVAYRLELTVPGLAEPIVGEGTLPAGPTGPIEVPLSVELASAPDVADVRAASPEAARAALEAAHSRSNGTGEWVLLASFAPGAPGPLGSETFTVEALATLRSYAAEVVADLPEVSR